MSWNNCKKFILARSTFNSALFKVLLTLKLLHGSRGGAKGSTLEDIAMHMIKYFSLDGDIKSQVLASLKFGVKMHYIQRKKDKFSLVLPASSVFLAPCKFKEKEIERTSCIFPPTWQSNSCNDSAICGGDQSASCCGKRKRSVPRVCCQGSDEEDDEEEEDPCAICRSKANRTKSSGFISKLSPRRKKSRRAPCPIAQPPRCVHRSISRRGDRNKALYDDLCQFCSYEDDNETKCNPGYAHDAHKNCSCCSK